MIFEKYFTEIYIKELYIFKMSIKCKKNIDKIFKNQTSGQNIFYKYQKNILLSSEDQSKMFLKYLWFLKWYFQNM